MTSRPEPAVDNYEMVCEMFRALSAPLRVQIVDHLASTPDECVHALVEALGAPQPLVSQHLRVLRQARLVSRRREGREMRYSLADHHVAHIVQDALEHSREDHDHDHATDPDDV